MSIVLVKICSVINCDAELGTTPKYYLWLNNHCEPQPVCEDCYVWETNYIEPAYRFRKFVQKIWRFLTK